MAPLCEGRLACRAQVARPVDFAERCYQPASSVLLTQRHGRGPGQTTFATANGAQGHIAHSHTCVQQGCCEDVSHARNE